MIGHDLCLVGDIGGTNARFALVEYGSVELTQCETLKCAEYDNVDLACKAYFDLVGVDIESVNRACLAFACPVQQEEIRLTNNHWKFTRSGLKASLGLESIKIVNDFTAMALGMLNLNDDEVIQVGGNLETTQAEFSDAPRLVIGPGTGLGVSGLIKANDDWIPLASEGGHISFAPIDELDIIIWRYLNSKYDRVSAERVLCGQGLVNIYEALVEHTQSELRYQKPSEVAEAAIANEDPRAVEALSRFCRILGTVSGDNVLTLGARGGVYLCGGILPRMIPFFKDSEFREAFEDKGRFNDYLSLIPVWLCVAEQPGLVGAAAALFNEEVFG
jgi:glucokinase